MGHRQCIKRGTSLLEGSNSPKAHGMSGWSMQSEEENGELWEGQELGERVFTSESVSSFLERMSGK